MPEYRHGDTVRDCPVELAFALVGQRWKVRILMVLSRGTLRYGALRDALPGISDKVLSHCLKEMEADGLVSRRVYAEVPARVEYAITDAGAVLWGAFQPVRRWGLKHGV